MTTTAPNSPALVPADEAGPADEAASPGHPASAPRPTLAPQPIPPSRSSHSSPASHPSPATDNVSFAELARRADAARTKVAKAEPATRELLTEATDAITAFHRAGLVTLVRALRADPRGAELLYAALDQPEVMALLVAHDIVRADRAVEVLAVIEQIRPYLAAAGTDAEVVQVDDDVAYIRFAGRGCEAPPSDLKDSVLETLLDRVPGLREAHEVAPAASDPAFIPLGSLRVGPPGPAPATPPTPATTLAPTDPPTPASTLAPAAPLVPAGPQ